MKKLFFALFLPIACLAQQKGDNQIIVTTDTKADELFKKVGQVLLEQNYTIDKSDKELGYITTEFKSVFGDRSVRVKAQIKDDKVIVTGLMGVGDKPAEIDAVEIKYNPSKSMIFYKVWPYLDKIAKELGINITYAKRD